MVIVLVWIWFILEMDPDPTQPEHTFFLKFYLQLETCAVGHRRRCAPLMDRRT